MEIGLLFSVIVERADLHRSAARYVLDRATELKIRPAAGKGQGRRMSIDEAVRLAFCAQLVMHGVPLQVSQQVTNWCERRWRACSRANHKPQYLFDSHATTPWCLELSGARYVRFRHDRHRSVKENDTVDDEQFYDVVADQKVKEWELDPHVPLLRWNVTALAARLAGAL